MSAPPILSVVLERLENVRKCGQGFRAKCPAHAGRSAASLSISQGDDGRILLHDFGGCDPLSVVQAIGLGLTDLFPERLTHTTTPEDRRRIVALAKQSRWEAAREMLQFEGRVLWVFGHDRINGEQATHEDLERLSIALDRIQDAGQVLNAR